MGLLLVTPRQAGGRDTRNVTDRCNVTPMSNICRSCGKPLTGRSDRKFCSAACRQRDFRNRHVTDTSNVTTTDAAPYELSGQWAKTGQGGEFWELVHALDPDYLPPTPDQDVFDEDIPSEEGTFSVPTGIISNGRRKSPEQSDIDFGRQRLNEFVNSYSEHRAILDRAHATARALLAQPPYTQET